MDLVQTQNDIWSPVIHIVLFIIRSWKLFNLIVLKSQTGCLLDGNKKSLRLHSLSANIQISISCVTCTEEKPTCYTGDHQCLQIQAGRLICKYFLAHIKASLNIKMLFFLWTKQVHHTRDITTRYYLWGTNISSWSQIIFLYIKINWCYLIF